MKEYNICIVDRHKNAIRLVHVGEVKYKYTQKDLDRLKIGDYLIFNIDDNVAESAKVTDINNTEITLFSNIKGNLICDFKYLFDLQQKWEYKHDVYDKC